MQTQLTSRLALTLLVLAATGACKPRTDSGLQSQGQIPTGILAGTTNALGHGIDLDKRRILGDECVVPYNRPTTSPVTEDPIRRASRDQGQNGDGGNGGMNLADASVGVMPVQLQWLRNSPGNTGNTGNKGMGLAEDRSRYEFDIQFFKKTVDVKQYIEQTYQVAASFDGDISRALGNFMPLTDGGGEGAKSEQASITDLLSGQVMAAITANMSAKVDTNDDKVFALVHAKITYPDQAADEIQTPFMNTVVARNVFGMDETRQLPTKLDERSAAYNKFLEKCGHVFVERVTRGRELWLVGITSLSQLKMEAKAMYNVRVATDKNAQVLSTDASDAGPGAPTGSIKSGTLDAEVQADIRQKTNTSFSYDAKIENAEIQIKAFGRFNNKLPAGIGSVGEMLTATEFMMGSSGPISEEAIFAVGVRDYGPVKLQHQVVNPASNDQDITTKISDVSDVFTPDVLEKVKLRDHASHLEYEISHAQGEMDTLKEEYSWAESYGPVFNYRIRLHKYLESARQIKALCAKRSDDARYQKTQSKDTLCGTKLAAFIRDEVPNRPLPPANLPRGGNTEVIARVDNDSYKNFSAARTYCQGLREADYARIRYDVPTKKEWENIITASRNYIAFRLHTASDATGYDFDNDTNPLATFCNRYTGKTFWVRDGNSTKSAVKIPECWEDRSKVGYPKDPAAPKPAPSTYGNWQWFTSNFPYGSEVPLVACAVTKEWVGER